MDKTIQRACTFLRWHYPDQVMGFGYRFIRSQPRTRSTPFFYFPATFDCVFIIPDCFKKSRDQSFLREKPYIFGNPDKLFCLSDLDSGK